MKTDKLFLIFAFSMVLLCCFSAVSASQDVANATVDEAVSAVDSDDEPIAVSSEECLESVDDSNNESLAIQEPVEDVNDDEISSQPQTDVLSTSVSSAEQEPVLKATNSDVLSVKLINAKKTGKISAYLATSKLKTTWRSGETFQVNMFDSKTKMPVVNAKLLLKVYTGKKYKKVTVTTSPKELVAQYSLSKLSLGTHKVIISCISKNIKAKPIKSSIKISKASVSISAPSVTKVYKKSQKFRITVKNKKSEKAMKGIKVIVKVYTGKKYKTYKLKTNKKGSVFINTKKLSKGKHKVVIKVKGTKKLKASSKKSTIKIVKSISKPKIKTHFDNVYVDYKYNGDGTFRGYEYSFTLWSSNGEIIKPVVLKSNGHVLSTCKSNEYITITQREVEYWGESFVLVFEGDDKYAGCTYRLM